MSVEPDNLTPVLARSLGGWADRAPAVAEVLLGAGLGLTALEASVRVREDDAPSGNRMMIERLPAPAVPRLLDVLGCALPALVDRLLRRAAEHGLPLIGGWDASARPAVAKIYANASDASLSVRRALRCELDCPPDAPDAPHVVGFNFAPGRMEVKLYEQWEELAPDAPAALSAWASGLGVAGVVRSVRVGSTACTTKAWFVALRRSDGAVESRLRSIPGWDDTGVRARFPFEPGLVKSVGLSDDGSWTVYFKPRDWDGSNWSLEPVVCLADGATEVGIYLEPSDTAPRAYERTGRYAVSYRVRQGSTEGRPIEPLMEWAVARVRASEDGARIDFSAPPEPWHVVSR